MNGVGLRDVVAGGQRLPVPTVTKSNGEKRVAALDHVLAGGDRLANGSCGFAAISVDDTHSARRRAGAADQKDTQGNANHQTLKTC